MKRLLMVHEVPVVMPATEMTEQTQAFEEEEPEEPKEKSKEESDSDDFADGLVYFKNNANVIAKVDGDKSKRRVIIRVYAASFYNPRELCTMVYMLNGNKMFV